jgi:integrase
MAAMEKTRTPGVYKRGSRYVVVWRHRGKQHKSFHRTYEEAREAKAQRQAGDKRPVSKIRFGDYFSEWIDTYAGRTARGFSETTRPEYRRPIEAHAMPRWKTWKLADVEPADVRELFGSMRRDDETTSQIRKLRASLSTMFATALDDGLIRMNPCQGVRVPAAASGALADEDRAKALTREELRLLIAAVPEDWRLLFEFLAVAGLRCSEAFGLTWEHMELGDAPRVKVREQFYEGQRKGLKSSSGRRDIPLTPATAARLLAHRRDTYGGPSAPVFPSKAGTPLIRGRVAERVLNPARKAVGLPWVSFHAFRHTCASLLFEEGRNIRQVSEWLGHADPAFTLRTYVHLLDAGVGQGLELPGVGNAWATQDPVTAENAEPADTAKSPA